MELNEFKSYSADQLKAMMKDPAKAPQLIAIMRTREGATWTSQLLSGQVQPEGAAAVVIPDVATEPVITDEVVTDEVVAPSTEVIAAQAHVIADEARAKAQADEDAALEAQGIKIYRAASGAIEKIVQNYQVLDEDNKAIGRPTHLEARTWIELVQKQRAAHENATRFGQRMKTKLTFKQEPKSAPLNEDEINQLAQEAVASADVHKVIAGTKRIAEQRVAEREAKVTARESEVQNLINLAVTEREAYKFMSRHVQDFYPCDANEKAMTSFLEERGLEATVDNLEVAFALIGDSLAQRPTTVPVTAAPNALAVAAAVSQPVAVIPTPDPAPAVPVSVAPVVPAPVAAPSQPASVAPAPTSVAAINPPAARRPGVNGSLPPGTLSAPRPNGTAPTLTMADVQRMAASGELKKRKSDPQFRAQLELLGIRDIAAKK